MAIDQHLLAKLLDGYKENRTELHKMVDEAKDIKENVRTILDSINTDHRNRYLMDEKIKILSTILSNELNIRKEISKSFKDEIDIRGKLGEDGNEISLAKVVGAMEKKFGVNFDDFLKFTVDEKRKDKEKYNESISNLAEKKIKKIRVPNL
jgi:hypothetical protein